MNQPRRIVSSTVIVPAIVVVLMMLGVAAGLAINPRLVPRPASTGLPTVSFAGLDPGLVRRAGFRVTNSGPHSVLMHQVRIQSAVDGSWKTLSEKPPEFSTLFDAPLLKDANGVITNMHILHDTILAPGEHRRIVVDWPEDRPWRVCILFVPEMRGVDALLAKTQMAWQRRTMRHWTGRYYGGSAKDLKQAVSEEITK